MPQNHILVRKAEGTPMESHPYTKTRGVGPVTTQLTPGAEPASSKSAGAPGPWSCSSTCSLAVTAAPRYPEWNPTLLYTFPKMRTPMTDAARFQPASDQSLFVYFGPQITLDANQRV